MDVIPLAPGFGAELRGVTLADIVADDATYAAARSAFEQHSVLVFRNQDVTDELQLAYSRSQIAPDLASPEERAALPPQCWRMVWKNPVNGRGAIYLASHAYAVEGIEPAAGKRLIDQLMEAATAPGVSYLHQWRTGDVV